MGTLHPDSFAARAAKKVMEESLARIATFGLDASTSHLPTSTSTTDEPDFDDKDDVPVNVLFYAIGEIQALRKAKSASSTVPAMCRLIREKLDPFKAAIAAYHIERETGQAIDLSPGLLVQTTDRKWLDEFRKELAMMKYTTDLHSS